MSYKYDRWENLLWAAVVAFILFVAFAIWKTSSVDGRSDYCYIEHQPGGIGVSDYVRLVAHVPWRSDRHLGNFKDVVEATSAAKIAGCPEVR